MSKGIILHTLFCWPFHSTEYFNQRHWRVRPSIPLLVHVTPDIDTMHKTLLTIEYTTISVHCLSVQQVMHILSGMVGMKTPSLTIGHCSTVPHLMSRLSGSDPDPNPVPRSKAHLSNQFMLTQLFLTN